MIEQDSSEWTDQEVQAAVEVLQKVACTQWAGKYLPLPVYEAHLAGKVNFSLELALSDGKGRYYVVPRPEGDVYAGLWHFAGVTFIITDAEAGDLDFTKAFARFEQAELGGNKLTNLTKLGHSVAHDPPRGPYVQFIYTAQVEGVVPNSAEKTGGQFMTLAGIEELPLVPSHRDNILPLVRTWELGCG